MLNKHNLTKMPLHKWGLFFLCFLAGCDRPLEKIAKDWCEVIRASQIIPVYPLTEDLQPGDVFLVTQPVQDQAAIYKKRGFLPFDYHIARLNISEFEDRDYSVFYQDDYWQGDYAAIPHSRPHRNDDSNTPVQTYAVPRAAFPSYAFTVKNNQGIQLALPVQGVPVGMDLLNATSAAGTINITDAYTYGIDARTLANVLHEKVNCDTDLQAELTELIATHPKVRLYLRIVYRVYLTGGVDINLKRESNYGLLGEVGSIFVGRNTVNKPLDPNNIKNYAEAFKAVSGDSTLPLGGAIRLTGSSGLSVSLKENFDRLLVIGYLGVDMPVLADGTLGTPVATSALLYNTTKEPPLVTVGASTTYTQRQIEGRILIIQSLYNENKADLFREQLLWADDQLGKPTELSMFRENYTTKKDFTESSDLFYKGFMRLASKSEMYEGAGMYKKTMTILDHVIDNIE